MHNLPIKGETMQLSVPNKMHLDATANTFLSPSKNSEAITGPQTPNTPTELPNNAREVNSPKISDDNDMDSAENPKVKNIIAEKVETDKNFFSTIRPILIRPMKFHKALIMRRYFPLLLSIPISTEKSASKVNIIQESVRNELFM
ncbi:hypothetical protein TNCV_8481 [Trichonephila clavipes]|nr:hypothetical protein TNCV_8481 [Trichonephila clavipes]